MGRTLARLVVLLALTAPEAKQAPAVALVGGCADEPNAEWVYKKNGGSCGKPSTAAKLSRWSPIPIRKSQPLISPAHFAGYPPHDLPV